MSLGDAMRRMIGIETEEDEIEITDDEIAAKMDELRGTETAAVPTGSKRSEAKADRGIGHKADHPYESIEPLISRGSQGRSYSMNGSGPFKMLVIEPKNFDECTKLVDNLKSRKPVIINLERVETDLARKMFDFMSGATYALNGNVQRVTSNIFIFAPANVDIAAKVARENGDTGYSANKNSPWGK